LIILRVFSTCAPWSGISSSWACLTFCRPILASKGLLTCLICEYATLPQPAALCVRL